MTVASTTGGESRMDMVFLLIVGRPANTCPTETRGSAKPPDQASTGFGRRGGGVA
jgi:hypothetical protein